MYDATGLWPGSLLYMVDFSDLNKVEQRESR